MKRTTQILIALVGILLTGFAVPAAAQAEPTVNFTVSQSSMSAPSTVTVTDTTSNPDRYTLTYEWQKNYQSGAPSPDVKAGSPECLNPECSQARWTYSSPGTYDILGRVNWSGGSSIQNHSVTVVDPADAPADIVMVSPGSLELPGSIVLASPKPNMTIGWCYQGDPDPDNNWLPLVGQGLGCFPYFVERTGPDASGLYYFRWRLPMSPPGLTVLQGVRAWSSNPGSGDVKHLTFTVTGNRIRYGDFRTCIDRFRRNAQLIYYTSVPTQVTFTVKQKVHQGQRSVWKVRKVRHRQFDISPLFPYVPVWAKYKIPHPLVQKRTRPPTRAFYVVRHGKKVIKRIGLSKRPCE